jgi:hypothetical protein
LVKDTISVEITLHSLAEVLAWGAGGRGFKSHWPQIILDSKIGMLALSVPPNS